MEWISVKDQVPEQNRVDVLVTDGGVIEIAQKFGLKKHWKFRPNNYLRTIGEVTHWMPLPEPPKL